MSPSPRKITIYHARTVRDASGLCVSPGAVAFEDGRVLAAGEPAGVRAAAGRRPAQEVRLDDHLLLPGLVNAHTHLDLTSVGRQPYGGSFTGWLQEVIARRPRLEADIQLSVRQGVELCRAAGTLTVGDICGSLAAWKALAESDLRGVGFEERFGLTVAPPAPWRAETFRRKSGLLVCGLQPHAPYSSGPALYRDAAQIAAKYTCPLTTHLAETPEESQFTRQATGPFRSFLEKMGNAGDLPADYGQGLSPVRWLDAVLTDWTVPVLLAHVNYADDDDLAVLHRRKWPVVYCPRASDYFEHRDHPYRKMMQAGLTVALGTDSAIGHGDQSILEEMRFLRRRDGLDAATLLMMATCNGLEALGLPGAEACFTPGSRPGAIAIGYDGRPGRSALDCVLDAATCPRVEVLEMPSGTP